MIVYLYIHIPSEMGYVGSTERSLEHRFEKHWKKCDKSNAPLHLVMRDSAKHNWLRVVLEEYDDLESMLRGEVEWMLELETVRPKVGFNSQVPSERDIQVKLTQAISPRDVPNTSSRTRSEMTKEEFEFYRECGVNGALAAKATVTHEERVANGKKGAAAVWSDPSKRTPEAVTARRVAGGSWWSSLSDEEKEAHREKGRQGQRQGQKVGV